jgi:signal transduction histidine kinase
MEADTSVGHDPTRAVGGWPLQSMFLAIAVLVLVAGAASVLYVNQQARGRGVQAAQAEANFATHKAANQLDSGITYWTGAIHARTTQPNVRLIFSDPSKCTLGYGPIGAFDTGHIDIVRADGSIICSSRSAAPGTAYSGQGWLQTSRPAVIGPIVDTTTSQPALLVVDQVADLGFIAVFLDLKPIGPKLASEFGSGAYQLEFMVASKDGKSIITRSIGTDQWTGASLAGTPFQATSSAERKDVDGKVRIYEQSAVPAAGWTVYVGADKQTALAGVNALLNESLATLVARSGAVLLVVVVVYLLVARPITTLSAAVATSGRKASPTPVTVSGPAQVRSLGESINGLIAAVARELAERHWAEEQLRESLSNLRTGDDQRRRLLASLVTAQEEERRRIASDVHDDSIQVMTAVVMRLGMIRRATADPAMDEDLGKLESTVQEGISRLRQLLFQLRPPSLDREGLVPALREYLGQWADSDGLTYAIKSSMGAEPATETRAILFRIAQEALTNVRKHSRARTLELTLKDQDAGLLMQIKDDGVGFRAEDRADTAVGHLGLVSMRERAELAGGWLRIHSTPGSGTTAECWIPVGEQHGDAAAV